MNKFEVTTVYIETEYRHGTIEVEQKHQTEWNTVANLHLTVGSDDYEKFCEEIQEVVRKYAL